MLHEREFECVAEDVVVKTKNKMSLSFPNFLTARNKASCCCSLFVTVTASRETDASFRHSKSLSEIQNSQFPLYGPRLRYLKFIKEDFLKNFHKVSQNEPLVKGVK